MATTSPAPGREAGPPSYYTSNLPPHIRTRLESGAFRSLCSHLRDRSDAVQNIDLMTVGGFCRNCLSKWRRVAGELRDEGGGSDYDSKALDALGYDEASEFVYGTSYSEWKAAHAKKATEEQMERYAESKPIHAQWDKAVLKTRGEKPEGGYEVDKGVTSGGGGGRGRRRSGVGRVLPGRRRPPHFVLPLRGRLRNPQHGIHASPAAPGTHRSDLGHTDRERPRLYEGV